MQEKKTFRPNIHLIFGILFLAVLGVIVYKYFTWGKEISREDFFSVDESAGGPETLDYFFPLLTGEEPEDDGETQILFLGNSNLAADRDKDSNICNIIAKKTNATVYNCGITESYMTAMRPDFSSEAPLDAFSFYWLTTLLTLNNTLPIDSAREQLDLSDHTLEALDLLESVDMDKIDVIALFYDAGDYFAGRKVYNSENETDITYFTGAFSAGVELLQSVYPNIRIIVLSPTYAFAVNEDGEYESSDILYYDSRLSDYSNMEAQAAYYYQVTFVDNLYGTVHEDIAEDYLADNWLLNKKGRERVADRFIDALTYYDEDNEDIK